MKISISNSSDKPIYRQLFDQISMQILKGELESGFALPSIRVAAKELRVSVITVKKAWEELETQGFINTVAGKGCFVASLSEEELLEKKTKMVENKLLKDLEYYKSMNMKACDFIDLVKKMY